ncbi:hypothetical protein QJQ45_000083 [Haematococcus lacustris]|nr:hypothetical protein QJQ45_000083 [Haematococcus lacustris]
MYVGASGSGQQEVVGERRQVIKAAIRSLVEAARPDLSPAQVDAIVAEVNKRMTMGSKQCCLTAVLCLSVLLLSFLGQPTEGFPAAGPAPGPPPPPDPACPPCTHPRLATRSSPRSAAAPAQLPPPVQLNILDPKLLAQIKDAMELLTTARVLEHLMRGPHHRDRLPKFRQRLHRLQSTGEALMAIALGGLALSMRMAMKYLDPYREQRDQASKRIKFLRKMLGKQLDLNEYEQLLAVNVVNPAHIDESIDDISGLDDLIQELEMKVLMPMVEPELFCTTLFKPARGVLLYGPPGTGKTMLAKALAKHSGCYFLNITASSIMSKWLGDANRLTRAIFTSEHAVTHSAVRCLLLQLAEKLQPCIIFIDEVDAMLGKRGSNSEHEASLSLKTGMVDEAVLRRFSIQHEVGLPDPAQRTAILRTYLRRHAREMGSAGGPAVEPALLENRSTGGNQEKRHVVMRVWQSVRGGKVHENVIGGRGQGPLDQVAARTEGFSGSDLMELCSQAAQRPLAEFVLASRRASAAVPPSTAASTSGRAAGQAGSSGSSSRGLSSSISRTAGKAITQPVVPRRHQARQAAAAAAAEGAGGTGIKDGAGFEDEQFMDAEEADQKADQPAAPAAAPSMRPLQLRDFEAVLSTMRPSTSKAVEYMQRAGAGGLGGLEGNGLVALLDAMMRMSQPPSTPS